MAVPLPLARRPTQMPAGIPKRSWYPWLIWLLWTLEERWRTLHTAWRHLDDGEAGRLLQTELAALDGWASFTNWNNEVGLPTGHLAACLTRFLTHKKDWQTDLYQRAWRAAERLVAQDVWPWFQETWAAERELTPHDIHNIPVIALVRGAQLARAVGFSHTEALETRAKQTLRAWWRYRMDPDAPHTEGASYDGYLMDTFTEWLDGLPGRDPLLEEGRESFASLIRQWVHATLPGRPDLHAPLSDVEPEMPFWMSCVLRIYGWYGPHPDVDAGLWLLQRVSPVRLPAAAMALGLDNPALVEATPAAPIPKPQAVANAAILRTGWDSTDMLALVGLSRSGMSHLHDDGGHVIVGWQNRFWITDPGYQQYRPGEERAFTLDMGAHNAPVVDGIFQSRRNPRLLQLQAEENGRQHASLDLSECYEGLPSSAKIWRDVWLIPAAGAPTVIVRDTMQGLAPNTEIRTHWQGGTHLAWAFVDGWARLSDGEQVLWIGACPGQIEAGQLERHAGSRGPLTLIHTEVLAAEDSRRWWLFVPDLQMGWTPPSVTLEGDRLRVRPATPAAAAWTLAS